MTKQVQNTEQASILSAPIERLEPALRGAPAPRFATNDSRFGFQAMDSANPQRLSYLPTESTAPPALQMDNDQHIPAPRNAGDSINPRYVSRPTVNETSRIVNDGHLLLPSVQCQKAVNLTLPHATPTENVRRRHGHGMLSPIGSLPVPVFDPDWLNNKAVIDNSYNSSVAQGAHSCPSDQVQRLSRSLPESAAYSPNFQEPMTTNDKGIPCPWCENGANSRFNRSRIRLSG